MDVNCIFVLKNPLHAVILSGGGVSFYELNHRFFAYGSE
jgi:hypothetical protein